MSNPRAGKLGQEYTVQKFYQLAGYPKYNRSTRTYYGGCPICREGKSWGRKRRLYFITDDDYLFCHNCGWAGNPTKFILEVSGLTYNEIVKESEEYDILPNDITLKAIDTNPVKDIPLLPQDSINLTDEQQLKYYNDNKIVSKALDYLNYRRLLSAINRPKTFWISLVDFVHKNRLTIPFYDVDNNIIFYQTRSLIDGDNLPKYLSKSNSDRTLFNIDNIDHDLSSIYIFEGPVDACFTKNGVAMAGLNEKSLTTLTPKQEEQLNRFKFHKKVWVLDSQWKDKASLTKTKLLINAGESVFIWPEEYGKRFKDFNDIAVALEVDELPQTFIDNNTYTSLKAKVMLSQIQI